VLQRSGFDPQAMPAFMGKLLDESRYFPSAGNAADSPCRKAVCLTPVTAPTRCARWLSSLPPISTWRRPEPGNV
jgi:hypothetical protein